jgi:hypothetical protein
MSWNVLLEHTMPSYWPLTSHKVNPLPPLAAPTPASSLCRLNPHRSQTLPAVSFFEGFQTPAGPEKTRAHSYGRHLKPITIADLPET